MTSIAIPLLRRALQYAPLPRNTRAGCRAARSWLWLTLLLGLLSTPVAMALEASVDRSLVSEGDSLTLTIRRSGDDGGDSPDYSPLTADFHLFGSRQSNRSMISNGRAESWTEWQVTLIPKRSGQLTLPPITVGNERTTPIRIEVQPSQAAATGQQRDPVFLEVSIDREQIYVEQQLLLTVRVFHALALEDMQLSDPEPEHASVEKVAQSNFRRDIDGVTYQVHELVYAIFADQPGELVIPELVFSGRQPLRPRSFFDFPGQGRSLRRMSPPLSVNVRPIPPQFSGTTWLPVRNLTLVESWNGNPDQLAVGDSMTRSLTLQAEGISAARLPELPMPPIEGGRLYADQPQLDNSGDAQGLRGKRVQSAALIPNRAGPLLLPGTKLVWWDVDSDSEKVAEISPRQLQIGAAPQAAQSVTPAPAMNEGNPANTLPNNGDAIRTPAATNATALLGWQIATALLACGWAATLLWWWRSRSAGRAAISRVDTGDASENELFKRLRKACTDNQPAAIRSALLAWGATQMQREQVGLDELLRWADDSELNSAVGELERQLFAATTVDAWRGENLLPVVERLRKRLRNNKRHPEIGDAELPPLYPR